MKHNLDAPIARLSNAFRCRHGEPSRPIAFSANAPRIDAGGKVAVFVLATDEEQIIAEEAWSVLDAGAYV